MRRQWLATWSTTHYLGRVTTVRLDLNSSAPQSLNNKAIGSTTMKGNYAAMRHDMSINLEEKLETHNRDPDRQWKTFKYTTKSKRSTCNKQ